MQKEGQEKGHQDFHADSPQYWQVTTEQKGLRRLDHGIFSWHAQVQHG